MAFGTGSAVAHRAVDSVMGPRTELNLRRQQILRHWKKWKRRRNSDLSSP
jgi:hypothetical protein